MKGTKNFPSIQKVKWRKPKTSLQYKRFFPLLPHTTKNKKLKDKKLGNKKRELKQVPTHLKMFFRLFTFWEGSSEGFVVVRVLTTFPLRGLRETVADQKPFAFTQAKNCHGPKTFRIHAGQSIFPSGVSWNIFPFGGSWNFHFPNIFPLGGFVKLSFSKSFNTSPSFWEPFFVKNENRNKDERGKRGIKKNSKY